MYHVAIVAAVFLWALAIGSVTAELLRSPGGMRSALDVEIAWENARLTGVLR